MTVINLYNRTFKGSVIMTGNSNAVSTTTGTQIGAFTIGLPTNTPPNGTTTATASLLTSSAQITIPNTATVRSAFLLWSATSSNPGGSIGNGNQNNNITLRDPLGNVNTVTPAVPYRQVNGTIAVGSFSAYSNAADVTSIVSNARTGYYTIGSVLGVTGANGEHNGWILIVAYEDPTEAFRNLNIWTALDLVAGGSSPSNVDIPISGFSTPSTGATAGRMIISAGNGNSELTGESTLFGPNINSLATLSGPNNAATNFFASQINDNLGLLNKTGTFGNNNSTPGQLTPVGARNNWDITRVDASAGLTNNQSSGIIRFRTIQDTLFITGVALQVDVNSANLTPLNKTVDKTYAYPGDMLIFTLTTVNSGLVTANNVVFVDTTPNGTSFVAGSVVVNNTPQPSFDPNPPTGFNIGNIGPNRVSTIQFSVKVNSSIPPIVNPITNQGSVMYSFIPATGLETIPASSASTIATTTIVALTLSSSKVVNKSFANVGDILTYTIPIVNLGNTTSNNIFIIDTIPSGTSYISGSLKQNGVAVSNVTNLISATLPNSVLSNNVTTVSFQVIVNTIPSPNPIQNIASIQSTFIIDPTTTPNRSGITSTNTNIVNTQINNANLGNIIKYVDKSYSNCGDTLNYTIVIPNTGNVTAQNIIFKDTIPNGTSFISNSVSINNSPAFGFNPSIGITIPNISPSTIATITFSVLVTCQ